MDTDDRSTLLFGSYEDMRIFMAIAELPVKEFRNKELLPLCGAEPSALSRRLKELVELGYLERVGRQGRFRRLDRDFWGAIATIRDEWDHLP